MTGAQGIFTEPASASRIGQPYVDQGTLDVPPIADEKLQFVTAAIAHVGRATDPEWDDAERTALYYPSPAIAPSITVEQLLAKERPPQRTPPRSLASSDPGSPLESAAAFAERVAAWNAAAPQRREVAEAQALALLEDHDWLRSVEIPTSAKGGRPTTRYISNPKGLVR